jgi:hypothetical protein
VIVAAVAIAVDSVAFAVVVVAVALLIAYLYDNGRLVVIACSTVTLYS